MNYEDSRNALFVEPNAYIQKFDNSDKTKKIVFQEPYECMPPHYLNNDFKKKECDCVPKPKNENNQQKPNFDFKNLMPLMSMFTKNSNLNEIVSLFSKSGGVNLQNLLTSVLSNKDMFGGILKLFKGNKNQKVNNKKEIVTTDYQIKNYTKVE